MKTIEYWKVDFLAGIIIMSFSIGLVLLSPWLYLIVLIIGMNLAIGNFRQFYNKRRKKKDMED